MIKTRSRSVPHETDALKCSLEKKATKMGKNAKSVAGRDEIWLFFEEKSNKNGQKCEKCCREG
jgi:hypothetical protein